MADVENILKEHYGNYDLECQTIKRHISEKDLKFHTRCMYAKYLKEPVEKKQIFFWCRGKKNCVDVPRYLFEYLHQTYGQTYTYIWVADKKSGAVNALPKDVIFVENDSEEYWRALACSKYLVGNAMLPNVFTKRKEQVYVNSMTGVPNLLKKRKADLNKYFLILKEMLKTDYLISDSQWMTERLYKTEYRLAGLYNGKIIESGNVRVSYMNQHSPVTEKMTKCTIITKKAYQWMKEHEEKLQTDHVEIQLISDNNCTFKGEDICDILAQTDVVIGDDSNYLRDACVYGCKAGCINDKGDYLGFDECDKINTWEEVKDYIEENKRYHRKENRVPVNTAAQIAEQIFGNAGGDAQRTIDISEDKKRVMILTEWELSRRQRIQLKRMLEAADGKKYQIMIAAPPAPSGYLEQEWEELPEDIIPLCYQGRMALEEKEYMFYRLIEKAPYLYSDYEEIRQYINQIIEREWERRWGDLSADYIVLYGKKAKLYFNAVGKSGAEKILAIEDLMPEQNQEHREEWQKMMELFDKIYVLPVEFEKTRREYGLKNQKKIVRQKVLFPKTFLKEDMIEHTEVEDKEYVIADQWQISDERMQLYMVQTPPKGACIVNTELLPDEKRTAFLQEFLRDKKEALLLGENFEAYKPYIPCNYQKLDGRICQELYMLPTAAGFYSHISSYVGDNRLEDDAMIEICEKFHIDISTFSYD